MLCLFSLLSPLVYPFVVRRAITTTTLSGSTTRIISRVNTGTVSGVNTGTVCGSASVGTVCGTNMTTMCCGTTNIVSRSITGTVCPCIL